MKGNLTQVRRTPYIGLQVTLLCLLTILLLTACGGHAQDLSVPSVLSPVPPTFTLPPIMTPVGVDIEGTISARADARNQADATWAAQGGPRIVFTPVPRPTDPTPPPPPLGIRDCVTASSIFNCNNVWQGKVHGEYLVAVAGGVPHDDLQGGVRLLTSTLDLKRQSLPQLYTTPQKAGSLHIAYVVWPKMVLLAMNDLGVITTFGFNLLTHAWEAPGPCFLAPIALSAQTISGGESPRELTNVLSSTGPGNFGWLSWTQDESPEALAKSLTPPGDSARYTNPNDPNDHNLTTGKWVRGRPRAMNSQVVRTAMDAWLHSNVFVPVPVWDQTTGQGTNLRYQVSGFAWLRITGYSLDQQSQLSGIYWGPATCPATP